LYDGVILPRRLLARKLEVSLIMGRIYHCLEEVSHGNKQKRGQGIALSDSSTTSKFRARDAIEQDQGCARVEDETDHVDPFVIKALSSKNLQDCMMFNCVKCLLEINFEHNTRRTRGVTLVKIFE
jgi:hypothetical protein